MNDVERWLARRDPGQRWPRLPRPTRGCSAVALGALSHAHIDEIAPLDTERGDRYPAQELPSLDHPRSRTP